MDAKTRPSSSEPPAQLVQVAIPPPPPRPEMPPPIPAAPRPKWHEPVSSESYIRADIFKSTIEAYTTAALQETIMVLAKNWDDNNRGWEDKLRSQEQTVKIELAAHHDRIQQYYENFYDQIQAELKKAKNQLQTAEAENAALNHKIQSHEAQFPNHPPRALADRPSVQGLRTIIRDCRIADSHQKKTTSPIAASELEGLTDDVFYSFLRSTKFDLQEAEKRLKKYLVVTRTFDIAAHVDEKGIVAAFENDIEFARKFLYRKADANDTGLPVYADQENKLILSQIREQDLCGDGLNYDGDQPGGISVYEDFGLWEMLVDALHANLESQLATIGKAEAAVEKQKAAAPGPKYEKKP